MEWEKQGKGMDAAGVRVNVEGEGRIDGKEATG